jgi:hypothetical protein
MEDEVQSYIAEFNTLRDEIHKSLKGLNDEVANWHPLPKDTNSMYALIMHLTGAQSNWIKRMIVGMTIQPDRNAEFQTSGSLLEMVKTWDEHHH